jgi:hypothetical protein
VSSFSRISAGGRTLPSRFGPLSRPRFSFLLRGADQND